MLANYILNEMDLSSLSNKKFVEIGAGVGLVGLVCASAIRESVVVFTDLPNTLDLTKRNIDANRVSIHNNQSEVYALPLKWLAKFSFLKYFPTNFFRICKFGNLGVAILISSKRS